DEDPATALIDGVPLTAANPMGFIRPVGERPLVVGLCAPSTEACTAGADRLDPATGAVTKLAALDDIGYVFWNQIVAGSDGATVYAHVKSAAQDSYHVIKLNVETGTVITALHQFPDERRYGIASDPSSRSLFIGGQDEFKGHISVYRDDVLQDTFALDGVSYHFALVPKP